ncbi:MAG: hypothetical protein V2J55_10110 [Candidatus Competibacteraceae bacterium]|jgi:hypothetical protein|nr:hypothetical protein [Candidatus Competibacteraceae bacterium]
MDKPMSWFEESRQEFKIERPLHFTNYRHCCECAEHDQTLISNNIDTIGLDELGSPGWDPICFCNPQGKIYYMPALIRLSLETINDHFYFEQLLFHLEHDGDNNDSFLNCSQSQKKFIKHFLEYMIVQYSKQIDQNMCADEVLRTYEIWSNATK